MELREFAERVLLGTTLAEKLAAPGAVTDEHPGPALVTPTAPGRPAKLEFKPHAAGKSEFPGLHRLEEVAERGKLLHFFGNHELLATELMALVLLKFPDAPAAFRKGVFQTLQDEQEHTRLYIERMKSCGLEFGDLPVSGYFWRCVAPMEHPIDYVAGLCLTFEQANLDFAGHYGSRLATVGDAESAKLLEKIQRDEIGHVAYGLKWFRRWKNPAESDWDAFCRTLKFPLSPQRAKGLALNIAGRRAAGLDPEFIAQLNVYSQSKGRTPGVFVFNAFAEGRLAGGKAFNPTKHQAQLARDLENLPQYLCRQDDLVLTGRKPSVEFLSGIKQAGFPLPEFVEFDWSAGLRQGQAQGLPRPAGGAPPPGPPAGRKLGSLRPWAWGPDSFELLAPLFRSVTGEKRADAARFNDGIAQLYAKSWSANFLRKILADASQTGPAPTSNRQSAIDNRQSGHPLPMNQEMDGASRKAALTPALSTGFVSIPTTLILPTGTFSHSGGRRATGEREKRSQRLDEMWRCRFKGSMREFFRGNLSPSAGANAWLCTADEIGVAVNSMAAARAAIARIRARGHHRIVAKQSFGVAGSNALRLFEPTLMTAQLRWMERSFAQKQELVIEPWLERLQDFSVQLEMTPEGLKLCGFTGLVNDARGQFAANYAESHHRKRIPSRVVSSFREAADISGRLLAFYDAVMARLEGELRAVDFVGPLGIDALVYRDAGGGVRLKPVVEINPRYTMGRVLVELMRQTGQNSAGVLRLVNAAQLRAEGFDNFAGYARWLGEKFPLQFEGGAVPRIRAGALCLNDPGTAQSCLAIFQAGGALGSLLPEQRASNQPVQNTL